MEEMLRLSLRGPTLQGSSFTCWEKMQTHAERFLHEHPIVVRPAAQGSQANPVSGHFRERELLGCMLQPSSAADRDKFDGLKALIILYALSPHVGDFNLVESCAEVRKGLKLNPPHRREIFEKLPSLGSQDYRRRLSDVLCKEASRPSLNETKKRYLRALGRLVGLSLYEARPRKTTALKNGLTRSVPAKPTIRPVRSRLGEPGAVMDGLYEVLEPVQEGTDVGDEPEVSTVFEQVVDQTEFGFDVALHQKRRKSAYWLEQSTLVSAVNRGVLAAPECSRLTEVLKNTLMSQDPVVEFCGGLLALSYLTSITLPELLRGCAGNEVSSGGEFIRVFPQLDIPSLVVSGSATESREICQSINIALPPDLKSWMSRYVDPYGEWIMPEGLESESLILEKCRSILASARDGGRYNLTESRVRHALRQQLSLSSLGALAVYLLTGSVDERPPILAHYATVGSNQLLNCYREALVVLWQ
jgi:hypothetical protein